MNKIITLVCLGILLSTAVYAQSTSLTITIRLPHLVASRPLDTNAPEVYSTAMAPIIENIVVNGKPYIIETYVAK